MKRDLLFELYVVAYNAANCNKNYYSAGQDPIHHSSIPLPDLLGNLYHHFELSILFCRSAQRHIVKFGTKFSVEVSLAIMMLKFTIGMCAYKSLPEGASLYPKKLWMQTLNTTSKGSGTNVYQSRW